MTFLILFLGFKYLTSQDCSVPFKIITPFFRPLLPSWQFFKDGSHNFQLQSQIWHDNLCLAEWINILQPPSIGWFQLFHNPNGTLFHAQQSLVDQISLDICHPHKSLTADKSRIYLNYLSEITLNFLQQKPQFHQASHIKIRIQAVSTNHTDDTTIFEAQQQEVRSVDS